jgi:hypothetical protein
MTRDVRGLDDPKKDEAGKLIRYHLENYKRNTAYHLPASLRPTPVQRSVAHDSVIDGIIHPELRNRMILLRDRYDLSECMIQYINTSIVHGDDVLSHTNWELSEEWVRQYSFLVDEGTLALANRWRRERGEEDIVLDGVSPTIATGEAQ